MKTAIVTGVAGFIGSHLAEKLLENKFKVIGIDNFTNYYPKKIKENNLLNCKKNKNFVFYEHDVINLDLISIFKKSNYLFHMAAQPGVRSSWGTNFETYVKENIIVTQKVLEVAKHTNSLSKIIMASSSSVYGNQQKKMNENASDLRPISPYGITKLAAENLCRVYAEYFELPIVSLRYFTVYGPRQRPEMAFMRFIHASLTHKKITIYGDGRQTRDFTFIDNVINASLSCLEHDVTNEVLNIGGGHVLSINDILKLIENISESKLTINYTSKQNGDVNHTEADISKASRLINYKPKTHIKDGLLRQYEFVKNNLNLYN
jgi:UDP-glucose 4-epimerase